MSNDSVLTRLIVGDPFTVDFGAPVGQQFNSSKIGEAICWTDGHWSSSEPIIISRTAEPSSRAQDANHEQRASTEDIGAVPGDVCAPGPSTPLRRKPPRVWRRPGLIAAGLLVVGAATVGATWVVWDNQPIKVADSAKAAPAAPPAAAPASAPASATELPIPQAGPGVRVVDQPYETAPAALSEADAALPIAPREAVASASVAAVQTPAPRAQAVRAPSRPKVPAAENTESRPPAVVLDEVKGASASPSATKAPAASPQGPASAAAAVSRGPTKATPAQVATARPPGGTRGGGLVAVTPDGKTAVFTNPTTRMPEQFKIGDKLPNGEVIRAIEPKDGRVVTSAKEYSLE
jgi:hypothetical protein